MRHGHPAPAHTLVAQREHRIYNVDGRLHEIRLVGSYTLGKARGAPHYEGGSDDGCTVLYRIRGEAPRLLELMDDERDIQAC